MKRIVSIIFLLALIVAPAPTQTAPTQHSIQIPWTYAQGADVATSFNVYRGTTTGGPYAVIGSVPIITNPVTSGSFTDMTGVGGTKYFYVVTAVDAQGFESAYSNEMSGTFLANPAAPVGGTLVIK